MESSEGLSRPVYAPHAKEVLFLKDARDGWSTQVVARDLRTGVVRRTGAPVELSVSGQDGSVDGEVTLLVTSKGRPLRPPPAPGRGRPGRRQGHPARL